MPQFSDGETEVTELKSDEIAHKPHVAPLLIHIKGHCAYLLQSIFPQTDSKGPKSVFLDLTRLV